MRLRMSVCREEKLMMNSKFNKIPDLILFITGLSSWSSGWQFVELVFVTVNRTFPGAVPSEGWHSGDHNVAVTITVAIRASAAELTVSQGTVTPHHLHLAMLIIVLCFAWWRRWCQL
jgi:hypothetical protein